MSESKGEAKNDTKQHSTTNTGNISASLVTLLSELVNGPPEGAAFMLNPGDAGLLKSLDKLSAKDASATHSGGASIAAHTDHVRYGLSLMNRWAGGEQNPWATADWTESWKRIAVTDNEWAERRRQLAAETAKWLKALESPRDVMEIELNGMISSIAHLAYHLGAIRQIDRSIRGPSAQD